MHFTFSYEKKKVIQALRFHFITQKEIRWLMIVVNVFAVAAAALFYFKKVSPLAFLLSSVLWMMLMLAFWFILPNSVYKKSKTFQEHFGMDINEVHIKLESEKAYSIWDWDKLSHFVESPYFFHLYFDAKSFFLVPKEEMGESLRIEVRRLLQAKLPQGVK